MDSLATKGELRGAHCDVSLPSCVYHTAFPLDNKELQVVTALGGSLWKARCEELGRRQAAPCSLDRIEMTLQIPKGWGRAAAQLLVEAA